ncbi:MAG: GT2 family glycosyltransferase [Candidatus Paceibacteria bacterium]|jgi:GT2 family glycosyltransferase
MSRKQQKQQKAKASANKAAGQHDDPLRLQVTLGEDVSDAELPRCAIIILNLNGRHHLKPCFDTLRELDYPADRFEVILIDNASNDGSLQEMKRDHTWVRLIENDRNVGFAPGCNQGAKAAPEAEVLVFLNNDMRVEKPWLRELVAPLVRGECQATTAKMYSWDGKLMNSAGGGMNFHGIGIQRGYNIEPGPDFDWPRKTLFACGGAMAMGRELFEEVGGFDDEFFAYYEDVDLGWRTWIMGHEVWYTPKAVCYHHHSSTSKRLPIEMIRLLQIRNPQLACFKNYDDQHLRKILPAMLALALRRTHMNSGLLDDTAFRIEQAHMASDGWLGGLIRRLRGITQDSVPFSRVGAADLIGMNDLLAHFDHWKTKRDVVQSKRRRPDAEIFKLFLRPMWCIEEDPSYKSLQHGLCELFEIDELFSGLTEPGAEPHK